MTERAARRIAIIGATSAIAEHCARLWVDGRAAHLALVGRDATRLARVADDLRVRNPRATCAVATVDFLDPTAIRALVDGLFADGGVDIALIAHGVLPDQSACERDLALVDATLRIDAISPVLFAEAFASRFEQAGRGTLAVIGSVAGDRGRRSNYVYGSAKGLVARYAEGLQHRASRQGFRVVLIKPGPTATPMTASMRGGSRAAFAPVESVARRIVAGIESGRRVVHAPAKWAAIMLVIRHLPSVVFDRLDL